MVQVSSLYVRKVIAHADPSLDPAELFAIVGMQADEPPDITRMIDIEGYRQLFAVLAEAENGRIGFHIRTGASMRCDEFGALGLAWKSSKNLFDGFERAARYIRLLAQPRMLIIEPGADETRVRFEEPSADLTVGEKLSNEASFATIISLCREAAGRPIAPAEILCAHEFVGDQETLEEFLQCKVQSETGVNAIVMKTAELERPNLLGDDAMSRFFDDHLAAQLAEAGNDVPLDRQVRTQISRSLSGGVPKVSDIAERLGMSARTLQRRLSDEELVFQSLVDDARRELAKRLLRTTSYPLVEVAFLTGFAEQSGFTRAFKRWSGQTPRSYRLEARPS